VLQRSQDPLVGWDGVEFGQLILRKSLIKLLPPPKSSSAGALPQTPLAELTALQDPLARFKGPTSKVRGTEGGEGPRLALI